MTPWLIAQIAFAAGAWYLAARAVLASFAFGGYSGRDLSRTVRSLRRAGRLADVARLGEMLAPSPLARLLKLGGEGAARDDIDDAAQQVLDAIRPPTALLRGLATVGTTAGLLAAVATLRFALNDGTPGGMERAASSAFDSAVTGFVTALPCWTAIALCRQRLRTAYRELDLVVAAMTTAGTDDDGSPPDPTGAAGPGEGAGRSAPVDEPRVTK